MKTDRAWLPDLIYVDGRFQSDLAIVCAGGATTTVYPTTIADDVAYILNDSGSAIVFAEDDGQVAKLAERRNEPVLTQWDAWGNRVDRIELTPLWRDAEALAVAGEAGRAEPGALGAPLRLGVARVLDGEAERAAHPQRVQDHVETLGVAGRDQHARRVGDDAADAAEVLGEGRAEDGRAAGVGVRELGVRDLRERGGAVVVQLEPHRDGGEPRAARRLDGVHAADRRGRRADPRGEETDARSRASRLRGGGPRKLRGKGHAQRHRSCRGVEENDDSEVFARRRGASLQ